jgi:hypothetical protein
MLVNDPQIWTLIGVFAAVMLGGMTLMTTQLSRVIRTQVDRVEGVLSERIDRVEGTLSHRIDKVEGVLTARIDRVEGVLTARIDAIDQKVDDLDTEIADLAKRFWRSQ